MQLLKPILLYNEVIGAASRGSIVSQTLTQRFLTPMLRVE